MIVELLILSAYWLVGPLTWLTYGALMFTGRRKMLLLRRPPEPIRVSPPPHATILIPAKDEGERIRGCLESALAQDYPAFNVIAINDRSADNTGKIMDEIAAGNPKLSVLHVQEGSLEPGWTGKNNALFQGQKLATGQWLLFVDSDVVLQPDALSSSMSLVVNRSYDLLSLLPRLESHSVWESLLVPLAASAASTMYVVPLSNNNKRTDIAFANGQFLLINRPAYEAMGTHAVVKDRYCEDVAMARIVKKIGLRTRCAMGAEWASVRMYSSLANIFKGWSRIYYAANVGDPRTIVGAMVFILLCCYTLFPALGWTIWRMNHPSPYYLNLIWLAGVLAHTLAMWVFMAVLYEWSGNPRRNALMWPISLVMLMGILFHALRMCFTKKVEWRGTTYGHTMASHLTPGSGPKA